MGTPSSPPRDGSGSVRHESFLNARCTRTRPGQENRTGEHARHAGRAPGTPCASPRPRRPAFLSGAAGCWTGTAPAGLLYTIGVSRRVTRKGQNPFDLRRTFSHQTATFTLEKCLEGNEAVATRCNRVARTHHSTGPIAGRPAIGRSGSGHERAAPRTRPDAGAPRPPQGPSRPSVVFSRHRFRARVSNASGCP